MEAHRSTERVRVAEAYEDLRPLLFSIAYRMLGSVAEAEDIVQEAFVRYQRALHDSTEIESPKAYLSAVTTRLAIDQLRSVRVRRESYVGQWLPEPLLTDEAAPDGARWVEELASRFFQAVGEGDMESLVELLADDVVAYGDGAGAVPSWRQPIFGRDRVARLLLGVSRQTREMQLMARPAEINGQPGMMVFDPSGRLINVMALEIAYGRVQRIRSIINPEKLRHLGPLADVRALMHERAVRLGLHPAA